MRKVNFPLSALSSFLHSGSFSGIEEKRNSQEPGKLIFSQVKCHILYFVLIHGELVLVLGEVIFDLEELIVPHMYYFLYFTFVPGDLVLASGEN